MSNIIELNPQDFARTQQGSCLMTNTNTDTGIKEPIALFEGRASGRTAVNRDGLIYDVLPYEPAFTLVDSQMVLSEEPFGETLVPNSGWLGSEKPTDWNTGFNGGTISIKSSTNGNLISARRFQASANRQNLYVDIDFISGTTYFLSVLLENANTPIQIQEMVYINSTGIRTYFEDGTEVDGTTLVSEGKSYGTKFEATATATNQVRIGCGTIGNVTGDITVSAPQLEIESKRTSFILSPVGATATRLGATGVETPDISKYLNSAEGVFNFKIKKNSEALQPELISLGDGLGGSGDRVSITYAPNSDVITVNYRIQGVSIFSQNVTLSDFGLSVFDNIDYAIVYKQDYFQLYINGEKRVEQLNGNTQTPNTWSKFEFGSGSGTNVLMCSSSSVKIFDSIDEAKKTLTYID